LSRLHKMRYIGNTPILPKFDNMKGVSKNN
jgi:hypothetical protein